MRRRDFLKVVSRWPIGAQLGLLGSEAAAQEQPEGQLTIAFGASIAPTFLDPAETPGIGRPFVFLYALHDALIKPLPGSDRPARCDGGCRFAGVGHVSLWHG